MDRYRLPSGQRFGHVSPAFGLNGDNPRLRQGEGDSGGEAAAAAGNEDQGGGDSELFVNLHPYAPLPFDDVDVVE
jgi:hypothetical protein